MIFGPSFDYDLNRQIELLFGGGIGFASHNDEIKSVEIQQDCPTIKIKLILQRSLRQVLIIN